jgi:antitoxin ParD1/3/4
MNKNPSTTRPPKEHEQHLAALRDALAEGEASGPAEPFDFDAFLASRRGPST